MLSVGLTGGIACGKSLAAGLFVQRGAVLIDADSVARQVVVPGSKGLERIVAAFGTGILTISGVLDREKLAGVVFSDREKRSALDRILHPYIIDFIFEQIDGLKKQGHEGIVIADIPLLYECGLQNRFDATVLVYADQQTQLSRLLARNNLTEDAARRRLGAQMPVADKRSLADYILENNGTFAELEDGVSRVWLALCDLLQKKQENKS